jgi:hypothetical protein
MRLVHAFPENRGWGRSWCGVHRRDVKLWTGRGFAGKLLKRITCSDCKSRLRAMLAVR